MQLSDSLHEDQYENLVSQWPFKAAVERVVAVSRAYLVTESELISDIRLIFASFQRWGATFLT